MRLLRCDQFLNTLSYYASELGAADLSEVILSTSWTAEQCLIAFRGMCRSIQRIHRRNIVHRDLKPANFLVMPDGSVKVSDFGTARDLNNENHAIALDYSGFAPGDIRYMAPEMLASLHDDDPSIAYRADIYSLGSILFEMFWGVQLGPQL